MPEHFKNRGPKKKRLVKKVQVFLGDHGQHHRAQHLMGDGRLQSRSSTLAEWVHVEAMPPRHKHLQPSPTSDSSRFTSRPAATLTPLYLFPTKKHCSLQTYMQLLSFFHGLYVVTLFGSLASSLTTLPCLFRPLRHFLAQERPDVFWNRPKFNRLSWSSCTTGPFVPL